MRPSVIVVSIGMLAACGGLAYVHASRDEPEATASATATQPPPTEQAIDPAPARDAATEPNVADAGVDISPSTDVADAIAAPSADTVEKWIKDTQDSDPKTRATAIANLASAPTAQALPGLREVVDTGEPEVDRHIALRSLHALALRDGDENGQVRDVMRRAIYHGDNDGVSQTAQSLLDDVEAALAEQ
ncbi:HEAT repeat domain-containing protein [Peristeroidobacter agariperforans]|uniref:HEAT repeat domain-containing protein n=1 Tax=Peristeroidobacter agariperforans TaxID=268404 RepID=UPI00101C2491|nr:HEAT repeat domain-containing protein [Peristeroidobacter agariperforans]